MSLHTNDDLADMIMELIKRIGVLEQVNKEQSTQMLELTHAWVTAKGLVAVIRWIAIVGAGLTAVWGTSKGLKL